MALLWAITFIAIVAAIAATVSPFAIQTNDMKDVARTADILSRLADAVDSFDLVVKRGNGAPATNFTTPNNLTLLSTRPGTGTAGCSTQTYNTTAQGNWDTFHPFGGQIVVDASGISTPLGTISVTPSRTAATQGTQRTATSDPYWIQIPGVEIKLARALDLYVDGAAGQAAGTVQYTNPAADSTTLVSYNTNITQQAC